MNSSVLFAKQKDVLLKNSAKQVRPMKSEEEVSQIANTIISSTIIDNTADVGSSTNKIESEEIIPEVAEQIKNDELTFASALLAVMDSIPNTSDPSNHNKIDSDGNIHVELDQNNLEDIIIDEIDGYNILWNDQKESRTCYKSAEMIATELNSSRLDKPGQVIDCSEALCHENFWAVSY